VSSIAAILAAASVSTLLEFTAFARFPGTFSG
jgi:hypothetical protein